MSTAKGQGSKKRQDLRPRFTIRRIIAWAKDHHQRTGMWPSTECGLVAGAMGETWCGVNSALQRGNRGLPGGTTLSRLLSARVGKLRYVKRRPLTEDQILSWARRHHERTGHWPSATAGKVMDAERETWGSINSALDLGGRGLPSGDSLSKLLNRHVGKTHRLKRPPLSKKQIVIWAEAHYRRTGVLPSTSSGRVVDAKRHETWQAIHSALQLGVRGLPGGDTLARLLGKRPGTLRGLRRRRLTYKQILTWADAHHRRTGQWPRPTPDRIREAPDETWSKVNFAMQNGTRGLRRGKSLSRLLAEKRGVPFSRSSRDPITFKQILIWADAHRKRAGQWPMAASGRIPEAQHDTWNSINCALRYASRNLKVNTSLHGLLVKCRGAPLRQQKRPRLTIKQILRWTDAHRRRTGDWPNARSGSVLDAPGEDWRIVAAALSAGARGLAKGSSLPRLLSKHRGRRNVRELPKLSEKQILAWADAHHRRTGEWPTAATTEPIPGAPGQTWGSVQGALCAGRRGLVKGSSLPRLLAKHRGRRNLRKLPKLSEKQILAWADAHHRRTAKWPTSLQTSATIPGASGETWTRVNAAMFAGRRGTSGKITLAGLLAKHRGVRRTGHTPNLTEKQIRRWAIAHFRRTGEWPGDRSGAVAETSERWAAIRTALRDGYRGLPGGTSISRLVEDLRPASGNKRPEPSLIIRQILLWARAHHRRTGRWPRRYDGRIPDAPGETWLKMDNALIEGKRRLKGGSSLAKLLKRCPIPTALVETPRRGRKTAASTSRGRSRA